MIRKTECYYCNNKQPHHSCNSLPSSNNNHDPNWAWKQSKVTYKTGKRS